jgi:GrpB-like predicted nucleotidyltransferase (UPF0157 family)
VPKRLGLESGKVELVATDPRWLAEGERRVESIRRALGANAVAVEHIGSTAVPGLLAKAILDLAVRLAPDSRRDEVMRQLEAIGYSFSGDAGREGGLIFVLEDRSLHRIAHLHVIAHDDDQWHRWLRVRDRLRSDPGARAAYASLKRELARRFADDRPAYTAGKDAFLQALSDANE